MNDYVAVLVLCGLNNSKRNISATRTVQDNLLHFRLALGSAVEVDAVLSIGAAVLGGDKDAHGGVMVLAEIDIVEDDCAVMVVNHSRASGPSFLFRHSAR